MDFVATLLVGTIKLHGKGRASGPCHGGMSRWKRGRAVRQSRWNDRLTVQRRRHGCAAVVYGAYVIGGYSTEGMGDIWGGGDVGDLVV